jgi:hypothetical protein
VSLAPGQDVDKQVFAPFMEDARRVASGDLPGGNDEQKQQFSRHGESITGDLKALQQLTTAKNAPVPKAYQQSLKDNQLALRRATDPRSELPAEKRLAIAAAVDCDLATKRKFAAKNADAPADSVIVTAYTPSEAGKMAGYVVKYKSKADADNPAKTGTQLGNPTNNAAGPMSPGCWVMWTTDGQKDGRHTPVNVGLGGIPTQTVELPLPQ